MSLAYPYNVPGAPRVTAVGDSQKAPQDPEIINRIDRIDQALGDLQDAVEMLTNRLIPVMTDAARGDGSDTAEPVCDTPIGRRLQAQESVVRNATDAVRAILQRLEI